MGLVRTDEILRMAAASNTSAISFMAFDYNLVFSVVRGAEKAGKPAIIMLLPEHVTENSVAGFESYIGMAEPILKGASVPLSLHLDHSFSEEEVYHAIDAGFTSVMFDASMDDLEMNIRRTRAIVEYAHARGVVVESELGAVGLAKDKAGEKTDYYTKPETVKYFCESTGTDALAISIGNAHGDYPFPPRLDLERLDEINAATDVPLVLHGGSGIPHDQLEQAFRRGINKFNYGTDVLRCYDTAIRDYHRMHEPPTSLDILGIPAFAQERLISFVEKKMELCLF